MHVPRSRAQGLAAPQTLHRVVRVLERLPVFISFVDNSLHSQKHAFPSHTIMCQQSPKTKPLPLVPMRYARHTTVTLDSRTEALQLHHAQTAASRQAGSDAEPSAHRTRAGEAAWSVELPAPAHDVHGCPLVLRHVARPGRSLSEREQRRPRLIDASCSMICSDSSISSLSRFKRVGRRFVACDASAADH